MAIDYQILHMFTLLFLTSVLSFLTVVQSVKTQDPFYIIAHMANTIKSIDWAVSNGANAIENDLVFDKNGNPTIFQHGGTCDCICAAGSGHICKGPLRMKCAGNAASESAVAQMQHVARISSIALYFIDSKVDAKMTTTLVKAGLAVIPFIDKNLFDHGYKGQVIIGSGKINTFDYIRAAATAAMHSPNHNRYYFTFDQEGDNYSGVTAMLSRFTDNRVYGTGISSCVPKTFSKGVSNGVKGKRSGETGMTYIWTLDKEPSMRKYINIGVQGIMTNRVATVRNLANKMGLRIAQPSDRIPISTSFINSPNNCDCDYHPGGCSISWPAPPGKACKCSYKGAWTCGSSVVSCDKSESKCANPDASWEACKIGGGDCGAYRKSDATSNNEDWNCGKRAIGYYPSWGKNEIELHHARRLTHIIFAFFEIDENGNVFLGSADRTHSNNVNEDIRIAKYRLSRLLRYQRLLPNLKIMFAVGGWENSQYFSSVVAATNKRLQFIASTLKIIDKYNFDGIDIDWEYPVTGGATEGKSQDKENYVQFMREIRQAFNGHKKNLLLSFAGAAGQWTLDPGYDLPNLLKYADFVNVMTYDFFGPWASKWGAFTGPPAPLYFGMPARFSGKTNVDWTIKYYTCKTKQPHKINMGVPFYGRYWNNVPSQSINPTDGMWRKAEAINGKFEGGFVSWREIKEKWLTNSAYKQATHVKSKASYAYNEKEQIFLGYESPESLKFKMEYAADKNVGGIMIWAIDQDDSDSSLLNIISTVQFCRHTDSTFINFKCSPLNEKRWWTPEDNINKAGLCGRSAPLYKGYYPLCDPDDPGYSCCGAFGYCGSGPEFCSCPTCVNYAENLEKLIEEPIRPTINPVQWYFFDAPDGRRGRCGRDVPKLNETIIPICNPDDRNAFCCSNGGYCGVTPAHCACDGCINFKTNPKYRFKPKKWWSWSDGPDKSGRCGEKAQKINGETAICDSSSKDYCCSKSGFCGSGNEFCNCNGCINYRNI